MRRFSAYLSLLLALVFLPFPAGTENPARKLTLMIYMCGSNLESLYGSASADYLEMTRAAVGPDVSVLVMMGGTSGWRMGLSADGTAVMEIGRRGGRMVKSLEKMNMGDGGTLSAFLRFGREYAPAEEYALILWDHGGGPLDGICWDEQYGADHLSVRELTDALDACGFREKRLGWIGFDACLMSSMEVASALSPYADYLISSQAEEPVSGWNYAFLRGLGRDASPAETGRRIVDAYFEADPDAPWDLTLSCLDLSAVGAVSGLIDSFFADLAGSLTADTFADISRLRLHATGFGRAAEIEPGQSGYDLVDLVSLVESYAPRSPEKAARVTEAVRRAVVYQRSTLARSCGMSVYHPWRNRDKFSSAWRDAYPALGFSGEYTRYVDFYGSIMAGDALARWDGMNRISAWTDADGRTSRISAELTPAQAENLAGARLVILARNLYDDADESYSLVYRSQEAEQEGSRLLAAYDGLHLQAMDISGFTPLTGTLSYRVSEEGTYLLPLRPFDENYRTEDVPLWAEYVPDEGNRLRLKNYLVFDEMTQTWSSRAGVDLSRYAGIVFRNEYRVPTANARGETLSFDQWAEDSHTDTHMKSIYAAKGTDFSLVFSRSGLLRAESLYAAFEITDAQGYRYMTGMVPLDGSGAKEHAFTLRVPDESVPPEERPLQMKCRLFELPSAGGYESRVLLNVSLRNASSRDMVFMVRDVRLNGTSCGASAYSSQGTGGLIYSGLRALAPGETGSAGLTLRYDEISPLIPDVSLREISFRLTVFEDPGSADMSGYEVPCVLETDVPLSSFCPEADVLPPSWLAESGWKADGPGEDSGKALIERDGFRISLRGLYLYRENMILHLRYENDSDRDLRFFLGSALVNGREASVGRTRHTEIVARDRRVATYGLDLPLWNPPSGVDQTLGRGESMDSYVTVRPEEEDPAGLRTVSFRTLLFDPETTDCVLFSGASVSLPEPVRLSEDTAAAVPASGCVVSPGEPLPAEAETSLPQEVVQDVPDFSSRLLSVRDSEGETVADGFYVLFRRVSSDAELAAMNIMNLIRDESGERFLSFPEGRSWLVYEAIGDLIPREDGSAYALFPGVLPVLRAGTDTLYPGPLYVQTDDSGRLRFDQLDTRLWFGSADFPDAVLGTAYGDLSVGLDPETRRITLLKSVRPGAAYPSLIRTLTREVYLIPSDADEAELIRFVTGNRYGDPHTLRQYQLLDGPRLSLGMASFSHPERYMVSYLYRTGSGVIRCTPPVPLE